MTSLREAVFPALGLRTGSLGEMNETATRFSLTRWQRKGYYRELQLALTG